jgi:UDP-N-acetylglucosamine--N-acetylmuramyl-(pentapeptide) pyrophosphoryl-undecaprenol N-acetylglucosamine transferase
MKILFTGGPGGHFFPIIAVTEEINRITKEQKILPPKLYFMSDSEYDKHALATQNIIFVSNPAGKMRRYFSLLNILDIFKTIIGVISSFLKIFSIFPDVIFSKGSYSSFPVVLAGRFFGIPVIIHESDSVPGRTNTWTGKFAKRIAVSYPEASQYFNQEKVAFTGNPLRKEIQIPVKSGAYEFLKLNENVPTILVLGGSQGSETINNVILDSLPHLVEKYQVIHQTGKLNYQSVMQTSKVILGNNPNANRYIAFDFLNDLSLSMSAGISSLVISRAGSTIFEIAVWGLPSIIIPITNSNGDHQRKNAFSYAREGACVVIEENNLSHAVLEQEIDRLLENDKERERMSLAAKNFAKPQAAETVAREILKIALSHEQ